MQKEDENNPGIDFSEKVVYKNSIIRYFGDNTEELMINEEEKEQISNEEFEDLVMEADNLLADNNIKGFITCLAQIDKILSSNPNLFSFFLVSHLGLRLSDLAMPEKSNTQQFFLLSDILLNLTAYNTDKVSKYSPTTYIDPLITSISYKNQYHSKDFFSAHLETVIQPDATLIYIKHITPILYNIASQINLKSVIDVSIVNKFFLLLEEKFDEIGFIISFLLVSFFRETPYIEIDIAKNLLNACHRIIPQNNECSLNIAYCLYYYAQNSSFSLLLSDENLHDLLMNMMHMENSEFVVIAYSILSFAVTNASIPANKELLLFFESFDYSIMISHIESLDYQIANYATLCLLNVCTVSEQVLSKCLAGNIHILLFNICKESPYDLRINAALFICLILQFDWDFHLEIVENKELFELLCELGSLPELYNYVIPAIAQIVKEHNETLSSVIDSDLPTVFESIEEDEVTDELQASVTFLNSCIEGAELQE